MLNSARAYAYMRSFLTIRMCIAKYKFLQRLLATSQILQVTFNLLKTIDIYNQCMYISNLFLCFPALNRIYCSYILYVVLMSNSGHVPLQLCSLRIVYC